MDSFLNICLIFGSFYEQLHKFFSPVLLVNYTISALLICMVGIQIVAVSRMGGAAVKPIGFRKRLNQVDFPPFWKWFESIRTISIFVSN